MREKIVLILLFVYAKSQPDDDDGIKPKPESCEKPADFLYQQCCVFPPFFTREVARSCGAVFQLNFVDSQNNVTALTRRTLSNWCDHWRCVLGKYDLLTSDNSLDDEKYFSHLDKWAELNPMFTGVISKAQVFCKSEYRMFMPLKACEFPRMQTCIRNYVKLDCPAVIPTNGCIEQKLFYDECREYFL